MARNVPAGELGILILLLSNPPAKPNYSNPNPLQPKTYTNTTLPSHSPTPIQLLGRVLANRLVARRLLGVAAAEVLQDLLAVLLGLFAGV